jgi:hypothetical protein
MKYIKKLMKYIKTLAVFTAILVGAGLTQAADAPVKNAAVSLDAIQSGASSVVKAIDEGRVKQIWDVSSSQTKKFQTKDVFVKAITDIRKPLGGVSDRRWSSIELVEIKPGSFIEPGIYINVLFQSKFAGKKEALRESVTYANEAGNWYFVGYTLIQSASQDANAETVDKQKKK